MPWSQPVRRMREFVLALHAIWACWQRRHAAAVRGRVLHPQADDADVHPRAASPRRSRRCSSPPSASAMTEMCGRGRRRPARPRVHDQALLRGGDDARVAARAWSGRAGSAATSRCRARCSSSPADDEARAGGRRGRHPQADRVLRVDPRLPQGAGAARLGRPADRIAPAVADGRVGRHGIADRRRRSSTSSPSSRRSMNWRQKIRTRCDGLIDRVLVGFPPSVDEATVVGLVCWQDCAVRSRHETFGLSTKPPRCSPTRGLRRRAETARGTDPSAGERAGVLGRRARLPAVLGDHQARRHHGRSSGPTRVHQLAATGADDRRVRRAAGRRRHQHADPHGRSAAPRGAGHRRATGSGRKPCAR